MSLNKYDASTGELVTLANGQRIWVGTKAAHDAAVAAGTMPNNCLVALTDDGDVSGVVDAIEDGNMNPVTSNAVYDNFKALGIGNTFCKELNASDDLDTIFTEGYYMWGAVPINSPDNTNWAVMQVIPGWHNPPDYTGCRQIVREMTGNATWQRSRKAGGLDEWTDWKRIDAPVVYMMRDLIIANSGFACDNRSKVILYPDKHVEFYFNGVTYTGTTPVSGANFLQLPFNCDATCVSTLMNDIPANNFPIGFMVFIDTNQSRSIVRAHVCTNGNKASYGFLSSKVTNSTFT